MLCVDPLTCAGYLRSASACKRAAHCASNAARSRARAEACTALNSRTRLFALACCSSCQFEFALPPRLLVALALRQSLLGCELCRLLARTISNAAVTVLLVQPLLFVPCAALPWQPCAALLPPPNLHASREGSKFWQRRRVGQTEAPVIQCDENGGVQAAAWAIR